MSASSLDRIDGGTIVLRERRVVYATLGAQALLGRTGGDLVGRELAELVAPQDRARVVDRHERRLRGEPVPAEYELQLLRPDGSQRTAEARVSVEGNEVVVQLQDLTPRTDRRRRLEGMATLGVALQRERTEAAIHQRLRQGLAALGLSPLLLRPAGDGVEVIWARLPAVIDQAASGLLGRPLAGFRGPWSPFSRETWSVGAAYADDWVTHAASFAGQGRADGLAAAAAAHGLVRALAVRLDERVGASQYLVVAGEWIRADDLPAFRLFGAQVAAALDSARDIAGLSSRNLELRALVELGRLSSDSATLGEFLPRAIEVITATAGCQAVGIFAARAPQRQLELIGVGGLAAPPPPSIQLVSFDTPLGAVVGSRRLVVAHLDELGRAPGGWLAEAGLATFAYVPLVARGEVLGVMAVAWAARLDAGACRPELLLTLGSHLAAAMEANQLLGDLRRRVGDLEAIHALALRALSAAPGETAALLAETAGAVARALSAPQVIVVLLDQGGTVLVPAAVHGPPVPEGARRLELGRSQLALEAFRTGTPTWSENTALDPRSALFGREEIPPMSVLAAPLAARATRRGVMLIADAPGRRFTGSERALASAMGAELALALENAELYADLRREQEKNIRKSRLEALGELSAVVAHEVRNPLGVIFNSLGSLRRLVGGGDARTLVDIVGEEADRLNRIVGDLLDFARHAPPQLAPDRLEQVVEEAVGVAVAQPPPGLVVVRKLDGPLPELALDAGQVRQAVLNLVVNAVQAMPGGGRLTVRTFLDGSSAVVEVEDTGPGIPEVIRARVFEPFFTTKATGTGLGLPVVKRIAEGHGGELRLRTGPEGTCFSLRFPVRPAPGLAPTAPGETIP